ncbi:uncharacterized protein LOC125504187 [Dendroctonus ponderosae]|uniref:uncharacterized protein LOC125504187 n=1 Tax=Dendroctonus ponderosae TaxID=77166 RepID=UPI00203622E4|nr:uncharacterized protein LOC125504187 [Dendroctonus ponderosae]
MSISHEFLTGNESVAGLLCWVAKAYDSVKRVMIWETTAEFGIPHKIIRLTRVCVEGSRCKVKIGSDMSNVFRVSTGLKQGDVLSPTIFNIALEKVERPDTCTSLEQPEGMNENNFENVTQFKYLGSIITADNDISEEIKSKIKVYKTVIRPIIMYGCESWTLTVRNEELIRRLERRILTKIYGPTKDPQTQQHRSNTNAELREIYDEPDLCNIIKAQRVTLAGHVRRQHKDRLI